MGLFRLFRRAEVDASSNGPLYEAVRDCMVEVRAYAQSHGGNIELVGVDADGQVSVRFSGACRGCPLSGITLKLGIEEQLKQRVPGVRKVIAV